MKKVGLLIAAFCAVAFLTPCQAQEPKEETLQILPYLQNPGETAITVCYLSQNASDVKVSLLSGTMVSKRLLISITDAVATKIPGTPWTVWKARIQNLHPGTVYAYSVSSKADGKEQRSETYIFSTLSPDTPAIKGIVLNDIHDRIPTLEKVLEHVKPEDYAFTIINGDMWNDPNPKNGAERVFKTMEAYVRLLDASSKSMFYVRGNHDVRGYFADRLSYLFDLPHNDPTKKLAEQNAFYDFRIGPVWFISPDAGEDGDKRPELFKPYRERQVSWLKQLFAESPARNAPWRVLVLHIPLYNSSRWDQPDALQRWESVYLNERIDVMLSGHDHSWRSLEKGKTYIRKRKDADGNTIDDPSTPPFPVLIGGGPTPDGKGDGIATVMFLEADKAKLSVRMVTAAGKEVAKLSLEK